MIPYGIVIKQNRLVLQQSLIVWQKKFGLLNLSKFIGSAIPLLSVFAVILCVVTVIFQESFNIITLISGILLNVFFIGFLMYLTAFKTVKEYAATSKSEKIQLVLNEETLEITTEFSKEVVPYNEIDFCYEKDFLLTIITDKNNFPLSVSKVHVDKGDYDMFVSLLKRKIPGKYVKKGEN